MVLPEQWENFYDEMCRKARKFIEIDYWSISESTLTLWLDNFKTDEEKFLSALLLYRLTFRNQDAVLSLFRHAIDIVVPNFLEEESLLSINDLETFHQSLQSYYGIPFRFTTIEAIDHSTAKSGTSLLRDFQRKIEYHKNLNVSPHTFESLGQQGVKAIIIIDDILGTGDNFKAFAELYILPYIDQFKFLYIPLSAYFNNLQKIRTDYAKIKIYPIEILNDSHSFFSKTGLPSIAQGIDINELITFYESLMKTKTKAHKLFGHGNLSLTHSFDDSVPNNMLPIYWYNDATWHKLFTR